MEGLIHKCRLGLWLVITLLALSFGDSALGQSQSNPGPPPNINPRAEDRARQIDEGRLRSAEMDATVESENKKKIDAAIQHMKEDFVRIQVIRNDIARNLVAHKPLDYDLVSRQTDEIHKRASRLNVYIVAHAPEKKDEHAKPVEVIDELVRLCKLIDSFTENPALKNASTLDVSHIDKLKEEKAQAERDLLEIIKISDDLHKRSEGLRGG
jgi:hypothetical protein